MAEASLFSVANRITLRLQEIGKSQGGLDHSLQQLEETISRMQGVLLDAEKQQMQNLRQKNKFEVRDWLREIGDSFYDADDLVDEYYTETLRQSRSGNRMTKQMKHILKEVMDKLDAKYAAAGDNTTGPRFHFEVRPEEQLPGVDEYDATELTSMDSYITGQIIGSDEERKVITQRLFENKNDDDVSVQAICGVAGSGKKEVARLVFNSEIVRGTFQLRMWVELSRNDFSDLGLVVEKIINSAAPPHKQVNRNSLPMKDLKKRLRNEIKGKRFLLIFDAIRSYNHKNWLLLKDLLTNGVQGNNIVVVTRSQDAADLMSSGRVLTISPLSYDASSILLNQVSVKRRHEPWNQNILERVRNNLDLWQGHPFIISVMERMFYFNCPEIEWSLLDELANSFEEENNIVPPLMLLYYQLPSRLKHCFAFCSLFPKGYEMDVQTLIKFWMAHGFIELSDDSQSMEAVGYQYFLQLLSRHIFEVVEKDELGNITKCTTYECMHDLAKFAAGNECKLLRANEAYASQELYRHVSFNYPLDSSRQEIPRSLHETKGIRTILLCNQSLEGFQGRSRGKSICDKFVSHFKLLRMLDLHNSGLKEVPSSIGKLKHLRYLDLSENKDIVKLPASITKLQNLQTLKLSSCYGLREWPKGFRKLVNLRHLELDWCYNLTRMPRGLGQLTNLQTLSEVVLTKRTDDELSELRDLKDLRGALKITNIRSGIQSESANLEGKQHLSSLMLTWDFSSNDGDATAGVEKTLEGLKPHQNLRELALVGYEGVKFSSWLSSLTRLVKFSLRRSKCQHIPPLSQLTSLKILILDEMTSLEDISDSSMNESSPLILSSLEELRLSKLPNLKGWWSTLSSSSPSMYSSFPRLSKLIIEDCPKLNFMPRCPNLKEWLVLDNTNWKPLPVTSPLMRVESSSSSSSSPAFSKLRSLSIIGIEELDNSYAEEIDWKAFKSLHFLRLDYLLKLEDLPNGLQHVISLKELHVWRCNIKTIPEWIKKLRPLERLSIWACPYLTSLPEGIRSLTSLETLEIGECPILLRGTGSDWDKIAHIRKKLFPWRQSFSLNSYFKNVKRTAYHESGHAIVAFNTEGAHPIQKATIMPRGSALGMVTQLPSNDETSISKKQLLARLDVCMGGRVAEELIFGQDHVTTGASSDLHTATELAQYMVSSCGMSDAIGPVHIKDRPSSDMQSRIDAEVVKLLREAYERVKALLKKHEKALHAMANALLEYETLSAEEIKRILLPYREGGRLPEQQEEQQQQEEGDLVLV